MDIESSFRRVVIVAGVTLSVLPGVAYAHARLEHASPAVGSTVHAAPAQVKLWFSEAIEPAFSSLRVLNANGKEVDKGDKAVSLANRTLLIVSVPMLAPGTYKVLWRAVSVDAHKTEGAFTFTVAR